MSRSKCPHCGGRVIIYGKLKMDDIGLKPHPNTGKNAKFNHATAKKMFARGATVAAIAQRFGVDRTSVTDMLKRSGDKK